MRSLRPSPSPYRALLFDLDDTLWDTYENNKESLRQIYLEEQWGNIYPSFEDYFSVYYPHQEVLWDDFRKGFISKQQLLEDRLRYPLRNHLEWRDINYKEINERYQNYIRLQKRLVPHALEVLETLYPYYIIAIISNGFIETQYAKMENSGLDQFIDKAILVDHTGVPKPDPRFFSFTCEQLQVAPHEALVIGDSWLSDIVGAILSHMDSIWLHRTSEIIPASLPDSIRVITDLRELIPLLLC